MPASMRLKPESVRLLLCAFLAYALVATGGCTSGDEQGLVRGDTGAALDRHLSAIVPYGFSGAVLVARDGEKLLEKGYGLADETQGAPNTAATVFTTGSITKQFTAAAVLRLEMDGFLSVDD